MADEQYYSLNRYTGLVWTPDKIQAIISGIENSANSEPEDSYNWANEDLYLKSNKYGVFFHDLISERMGKVSNKQDLVLDYDELIPFLKDFKTFIEENS
ncbi:MAG: hypothetical protein GQ574_08340 [Crocinitomix sp.]|nr:hypothetical protein [Crocinitomix sp.]